MAVAVEGVVVAVTVVGWQWDCHIRIGCVSAVILTGDKDHNPWQWQWQSLAVTVKKKKQPLQPSHCHPATPIFPAEPEYRIRMAPNAPLDPAHQPVENANVAVDRNVNLS
jgi:hypothetical protein